MLALHILFWASIFLIVYAYAGFPLLLWIRTSLNRKWSAEIDSSAHELPSISILVAAHNEAGFILEKLDNTLSLEYAAGKLEIIVASDGSTDETNEIVSRYAKGNVQLLDLPRQGKNATLNAAVSASHGEILVFTDADTLMKRDALMHLIKPFADAEVGAVGGDYHYAEDQKNGNEERTYWKYDRLLKGLQSVSSSMTSATGQIYAIRRFLFKPVPDQLIDDFYISVQAPAAHYRLLFEPRAVAFGPIANSGGEEFKRKVRVITGGLRTVWRVRSLLNPAQYGFYAIQLFTHKVLRRVLIIPLILVTACSIALWNYGWIYRLAATAQLLLHLMALAGYLLRNKSTGRHKLLSLPFFYDLVNLASLLSLFHLCTGARHGD